MPAIALCSMKGGTGKTTISFNLSERAFAQGREVVLLDFDPQEGSMGIADLRRSDPDREGWPVERARVAVSDAARLAGMKLENPERFLVCDLPGADSMALLRVLSEMDLVLSPVGSGVSDLMAAANLSEAVSLLSSPPVFLPNNVSHFRRRREALAGELASLEVEVCPVWIRSRVGHLDALRSGLGVCEAQPRSRAAGEINALWDWVLSRLEAGNLNGSSEHDSENASGHPVPGATLLRS